MTTHEFGLTTVPEAGANVIPSRFGSILPQFTSPIDLDTADARRTTGALVHAGLIAATTLKLVGQRVAAALTPAGLQALDIPVL
jgi:hypothetical protein